MCIMKIAEFVKINAETLKFLSENGIYLNDYQYMDMYEEYTNMLKNNEKKEYIYAVMKEKYGVPKRTQLRIFKRLSSFC